MDIIKWEERYEVKIKQIDDEHKKFLDVVNELITAMKEGKGKEIIESTIEKLVDYTKFHFSSEEKVFARYNLPTLDEHKKKHQDLIDKVVALQEQAKSKSFLISINVLDTLKSWLFDHIIGTDKKDAAYLHEKGLIK